MNFKSERATALLAARKAGKILMHYYGSSKGVREKPNKTLVSRADIEADKIIIKTIKKSFPKHNIMSEESGFEDNSSDYKWAIDPLDGTHNFLHKIPIFGTSIALEYKNEVMLGVISLPALHTTAVAEKGKGAFLNGKRTKVSGKKGLEHSFILSEFSYANRKEKINFLKRLESETIDVRNFGCAVYNFVLVASGGCDGYVLLGTNEWDVAAGLLIVNEAGGKATGLNEEMASPSHHNFVISNGRVHKWILEYIRSAKH